MSCCGVNMFHPGLSTVRCAEAVGASRTNRHKGPIDGRPARAPSRRRAWLSPLRHKFPRPPHALTVTSAMTPTIGILAPELLRSEERRVGKECRYRLSCVQESKIIE